MKPLSVLQVISSSVWGGREQHVWDLSAGLLQSGHAVKIVTRNNLDMANRYKDVAETIVLPLRNLLDFHSIRNLARLIKENNIDVIHTHTGRDAWLALLASKVAGKGKVFNTRHTVSRVKTDILHRWYYKNLAAVICVSRLVRAEFLAACPIIDPKKAVVVYNGVDTAKLLKGDRQAFRDAIGADGTFVIGYAGRISAEKGLEYLVEAAQKLKEKQYDFLVLLAGMANEEYEGLLKARIQQYSLEKHVQFVGFTKNVADFMNGIDVFVLPCVWQEAFGLVLCEAMVCGKPVITTTSGAQSEIITDQETGILISPQNPAALAAALESLCLNPALAAGIGANGKQRVNDNFTLEHMLETMVRCYREN